MIMDDSGGMSTPSGLARLRPCHAFRPRSRLISALFFCQKNYIYAPKPARIMIVFYCFPYGFWGFSSGFGAVLLLSEHLDTALSWNSTAKSRLTLPSIAAGRLS